MEIWRSMMGEFDSNGGLRTFAAVCTKGSYAQEADSAKLRTLVTQQGTTVPRPLLVGLFETAP